MSMSVAIDTGGTFVDLAVMDEQGSISTFKTPTTPQDYLAGILKGLELAAEAYHLPLEEFLGKTTKFVYGTTIGTNFLLEGKGRGRAGLLVTKGFRDTLYIRRGIRRSAFDTQDPFPLPVIRRLHTREISERIDWAGNVLTPPDEEEVKRIAKELVQERRLTAEGRLEAIGICFLHSYANPTHERRAAELLRREFPDLFITASFEVAPEIREYERMSTVAYNAAIGKMFATHLVSLGEELQQRGLRVPVLVMQSNGGTAEVVEASIRPVASLISGPVGGIIAGEYMSSQVNASNIITADMGGTSLDVGIIRDGKVITTMLAQLAGYPVMGERVEIQSTGAGGGSIAWVDEQGILRVGPRSAGADPGPACYDKGGADPTVTDANVVLGYINPDYFLGGAIRLNAQKAQQAIKEKVADRIGGSPVQAASGIVRIANENMVNALRVLTVQRGYDPRDFLLMFFGGAGPAHATSIFKELGVKGLVIPVNSSAFSAFGMLFTSLKHSYARSYRSFLDKLNLEKANELMLDMERQAIAALDREGVTRDKMRLMASTDMCYEGQIHELNVPIGGTAITGAVLEEAKESFARKYESLYGFQEELPVQVVTFRLDGIGETAQPVLKKYPLGSKEASTALKSHRRAYFQEEGGFISTPIYDGTKVQAGNELVGPAIVEYPTTTLVLRPKQRVKWDQWLNATIS